MKRRRPFRRAAPPEARPPRPPDLEAIRSRQAVLEPLLDNREQSRLRAAAERVMADAAAAAASVTPDPARPAPTSPVLAIPVRRVITSTPLSVCVDAWGLEVWVPRGACHDPEDPILTHHLPGELRVSSSWAHRAGLPPTTRSTR